MTTKKPKKNKEKIITVKGWAVIDKITKDICHYLTNDEIYLFRSKKVAKQEYGERFYDIVKAEIKIKL